MLQGLLYNLYGDKVLNLKLVPQAVYDMQSAFYPTVAGKYGVPLDTRHNYTKSKLRPFHSFVTFPEKNSTYQKYRRRVHARRCHDLRQHDRVVHQRHREMDQRDTDQQGNDRSVRCHEWRVGTLLFFGEGCCADYLQLPNGWPGIHRAPCGGRIL